MSIKYSDRVWFHTVTTGTDTIAVGAALAGYQTPPLAGFLNGDSSGYTAIDGTSAWETGRGTFNSGSFSRDTVEASSLGGAKINLSGSATVFFTVTAGQLNDLSAQYGTISAQFGDLSTQFGALSAEFAALPAGTGGSLTLDQMKAYVGVRTSLFRITEFGSIGDGASHPLSSITAWNGTNTSGFTAAQWRTLTGVAAITATTNEIDWLAIEAAKGAATAAGGGAVMLPPGAYEFDQLISQFPDQTERDGRGGVSLVGAGSECVRLRWSTDHGTTANGAFAISCANRTAGNGSAGWFRGFTMHGPGQSWTYGVKNCNLSGIGWAARRKVDDVMINGFYAGIAMVGDQAQLSRVQCVNCYYGAYWDEINMGLYGDQVLDKWILGPCAMAAIAASHKAAILKIQFNKPLFGASPYCAYKETNNGNPDNAILFDNCYLIEPQFELPGNAAIGDDRPGIGNHTVIIANTTMVRPQFGPWYPTAKLAGMDQSSMIQAWLTIDFHIKELGVGGLWTPGATGLWSVQNMSNCSIQGDIDQLISNCNSANLPFFSGGNDGMRLISFNWEGGPVWGAGNTFVAGSFVCQAYNQGLLSTGSATEYPLGVCMASWQSVGNNNIIVATRGRVNGIASGTINRGAAVRTAASGRVVAATGPNDVTTPVVGMCTSYPNTTDGQPVTISLRPWQW
jgi:hypothetical protein